MLPPRSLRQQQGAGLLIAFIIIMLIGSSLLLANLPNTDNATTRNAAINLAILDQAKTALIASAASHPTLPGGLPCPDIDGDGQADISGSNCVAYLGRLPWKTLDLPTLRDADGECLWYAVSKGYRSSLSASNRAFGHVPADQLNDTLPGEINLLDTNKTALPASDSPAIAAIFSPGIALPGQSRVADNSSACGNNQNAQDYLDTDQGINNASLGNDLGAGNVTQLILANASASFNDRATWISPQQLFAVVIPRVLNTLRGSFDSSRGIAKLFRDNGNLYPFAAATPAGAQQGGLLTGWVPYSDLPTYPTATKKWLENNGWASLIAYSITADRAQATLSYQGKTLICSGLSTCP